LKIDKEDNRYDIYWYIRYNILYFLKWKDIDRHQLGRLNELKRKKMLWYINCWLYRLFAYYILMDPCDEPLYSVNLCISILTGENYHVDLDSRISIFNARTWLLLCLPAGYQYTGWLFYRWTRQYFLK